MAIDQLSYLMRQSRFLDSPLAEHQAPVPRLLNPEQVMKAMAQQVLMPKADFNLGLVLSLEPVH